MATLHTVEFQIEIEGVYTQVDIDTNTSLSFNLQASELTDPAATKIPYSVQISLPRTHRNNDLFSHIGNYDKKILHVNPIARTNFRLYVNNTLYQSGYMQIESIDHTNDKYKIRLYGGLGDYFYTMSEIKLKDLYSDPQDKERFDFTHTVNTANVYTFFSGGE
ncbi:MAG: hypothetical protein LUF85_06535 [Bacteroides sp.]|nr:hypothetical protein [Bacteroides sp.]